jgi:hypothetical protein
MISGFAVEQHRSRIGIGVDGIDQDDSIVRGEMIDQVKRRGAQVGDFDALGELVAGGQKPRHVRADAVIPSKTLPIPPMSTSSSQHLHFGDLAARRIERVAGAGHAGIERVHGAQDLQRLLGRASGVCSSEAS